MRKFLARQLHEYKVYLEAPKKEKKCKVKNLASAPFFLVPPSFSQQPFGGR